MHLEAFDLRTFWDRLSPDGRDQLAKDAKTSLAYLGQHLIAARKMPRRKTIRRLLAACKKQGATDLTEAQLLWWFYERQPTETTRKKLPLKRTAPAVAAAA